MIGLGAWQFGSREWGYGDEYARREAAAITRRALDLGINLIDTAEIYGFGRSERIVGGAIAGRRDEVFLASKLYPAFPVGPAVVRRAQGSIRRLGVDRLDLYQVHALNPVISVRSTMRGMATLRTQGRIEHVGVSNFPLSAWQAAEDALGGPVLSNQVRYSLAVRDAERELLPWAQANDRLIIAYSPLAQGLLSGRYDGTNTPADVRARNPLFLPKSMTAAAGAPASPAGDRRVARRVPRPGRAGVADPPPERRGDPGSQDRRAGGGERGRGRPGARRRRGSTAHRGQRSLPARAPARPTSGGTGSARSSVDDRRRGRRSYAARRDDRASEPLRRRSRRHPLRRILVTGGSGFIGTNLVDRYRHDAVDGGPQLRRPGAALRGASRPVDREGTLDGTDGLLVGRCGSSGPPTWSIWPRGRTSTDGRWRTTAATRRGCGSCSPARPTTAARAFDLHVQPPRVRAG